MIQTVVVDTEGRAYRIQAVAKDSFLEIKERLITADVGSEDWLQAQDQLEQEFGACLINR